MSARVKWMAPSWRTERVRREAEHAMIFQSSPLRKGFNGLHTFPPSSLLSLSCFCSLLCVSAVGDGSRTAAPGSAPCRPVSQRGLLSVSRSKIQFRVLTYSFPTFAGPFMTIHDYNALFFSDLCSRCQGSPQSARLNQHRHRGKATRTQHRFCEPLQTRKNVLKRREKWGRTVVDAKWASHYELLCWFMIQRWHAPAKFLKQN